VGDPNKVEQDAAASYLKQIGAAVQQDFVSNRRVLSFGEYLSLVREAPLVQLRNSAQYLLDMFEHYGTEEVRHPTGMLRRFRLFDLPWEQGRGRLVGQEEVQNRIYRLLDGFARQGRVDRCILMHGPNGSSKSTISDILAQGMENYSTLDEGALYRFSWVFPTQSVERSGIGFSAAGEQVLGAGDSYAHLDESAVDSRLPCELRDHPLLLIPKHLRRPLVEELVKKAQPTHGFTASTYLLEGDLCHKCKQVFEALLVAYEGGLCAGLTSCAG
jgi:serine protein kinase